MMSDQSIATHSAATASACERSRPWRSTKAFCAPMAMMSEAPRPRPAMKAE